MKVFKFYCGQMYYGYAAKTKKEAIEQFIEDTGDLFTVCEEIPESEWNKPFVYEWKENNFKSKPIKKTIRDCLVENQKGMIFSNNTTFFD